MYVCMYVLTYVSAYPMIRFLVSKLESSWLAQHSSSTTGKYEYLGAHDNICICHVSIISALLHFYFTPQTFRRSRNKLGTSNVQVSPQQYIIYCQDDLITSVWHSLNLRYLYIQNIDITDIEDTTNY